VSLGHASGDGTRFPHASARVWPRGQWADALDVDDAAGRPARSSGPAPRGCRRHGSWLYWAAVQPQIVTGTGSWEYMAKRRGTSTGSVRVLTRKRQPRTGVCILIENGVSCANPIASRGLCSKHASYLRAHRRLEEFALSRRDGDRKHRFEVKADAEPGLCRVVVNGKPCRKAAERRGLCRTHYQSIWQRPDLDLEAFCLLAGQAPSVCLRSRPVEGDCRVRENGDDCRERAHARGLCHRHYRLRETHPSLFERVALPDPKAVTYTVRRKLVAGRCRVAENGRGCSNAVHSRGLCQHHYDVLRGNTELFETLALPARKAKSVTFMKRPASASSDAVCVVVENGVPCSRPPEHRGVCGPHRKRIGSNKAYAIDDFYTPLAQPSLSVKETEELVDGLCRAIEDGRHCQRPPHTRGLCRCHYRLAAKLGCLDAVASASRDHRNAFGTGNDRLHVYLDKNVLFDYVDKTIFNATGQMGSVALIEYVRDGAVRASVSTDGVKSTYNHLRHRLVRSVEEGGRAMGDADAERIAREEVHRVFVGKGAWRMIPLEPTALKAAIADLRESLSLEDALEFRAYQAARAGKAGPTMFVTRDAHFPEGVHPSNLAMEFGWM